MTPIGPVPRARRFEVSGIFEVGAQEYDFGLAVIHLQDAQRLMRMGEGVTGVRLKLTDIWDAWSVARSLANRLDGMYRVRDWTRDHENFFRSLKLEKTIMFVLLSLVIAIAAFNLVSSLVMLVQDKQADIAILRTLGAAPRSILQIFMVQGMVLGVVGTLAGVLVGVVTALNIDVIVPAIERAFSIKFLSKEVYLIPDLPSDLQANDVVSIALMALALSFVATLYPSWRAGRVNPAEALRYE